MKTLLLLSLVAILPLPAAPAGRIQSGQKIAFLGDSLTDYGERTPAGYIKLVVTGLAAEGVNVTPIPAGIGGNTSRNELERLDKDILSKSPDWMTLSCGINDVWQNLTPEEYQKNITAIVDQAQAKNIRVLIISTTPAGEDNNGNNAKIDTNNQFLRQLAQQKNCLYADANTPMKAVYAQQPPPAPGNRLTVDGTHLNPEGNTIVAWAILRTLGVPEADHARVEQAWLRSPEPQVLPIDLDLGWLYRITSSLTLAQYRQLAQAAAARHESPDKLAATLWLDALDQTFHAHEKDPTTNLELWQPEALTRFAEEIHHLTP